MNVCLLTHTNDPESTVAGAARLCYSGLEADEVFESVSSPEKSSELIKKIVGYGHLSCLEHASFTFGISGISRNCSHQLVRYRLASYSQQSQRYVKSDEPDYVLPQSVREPGKEVMFRHAAKLCWQVYEELIRAGVPKEDARFILPSAATTSIAVTMNARELLHFFSQRCCDRAQWEIRGVAEKMLSAVKPIAPTIFLTAGPSCVTGQCSEGSMTCGVPKKYATDKLDARA